ncbi:hypothetical protein MUG60_08600 [Kaistella montana]|nr:hypothetical protein [Micrococcus luteus]MCJ2194702.1 hypothetical protein [Kaistella montana]STY68020.1 Uncharacterised protein [Micrococcus luteus]
MRVPGDFPLTLRSRPFTRAQALAAGLPASRLRSRDVERAARGVHRWIGPVTGTTAPARAPTTELDRLPALAAAHPDVVVTGESAARLWGWPLPDEVRDRMRPTVLCGCTRRVLTDPGVRTRLVDRDALVAVGDRLHGLRWAPRGDAWFHLALGDRLDIRVAGTDRARGFVETVGLVRAAGADSRGAGPTRVSSTDCPTPAASATRSSRSASRGRESGAASPSRRVCTMVFSSATASRADDSMPRRWPAAASGSRARVRRAAPACTPIAVTWWATTSCSSRAIRSRSRSTACSARRSCCARISACAASSRCRSTAERHEASPNLHAPVK